MGNCFSTDNTTHYVQLQYDADDDTNTDDDTDDDVDDAIHLKTNFECESELQILYVTI